jgi:16S rRNA U1498 N3-methylase RsmE
MTRDKTENYKNVIIVGASRSGKSARQTAERLKELGVIKLAQAITEDGVRYWTIPKRK